MTEASTIEEDANVVGTGAVAMRDVPLKKKPERRPALSEAALSPFVQKLFEKLTVPNVKGGLGVLRHKMPQLDDFDAFAKDLQDNNIQMTTVLSFPDRLTPTQGNFNEKKVDSLASTGDWNKYPIITSRDDYVIDGHHRWLAAVKVEKSIRCRRIHMNAEDLLAFVKDKPYTSTRNINENRNK